MSSVPEKVDAFGRYGFATVIRLPLRDASARRAAYEEVMAANGLARDKTVLNPNSKPLVIPHGRPHKFTAETENTLTLEVSLPTPGPLNREDIERFTEHGFDAPN